MKRKRLQWYIHSGVLIWLIYSLALISMPVFASETGTVWAAEGYKIKKMSADGNILFELRSFSPTSVSINTEEDTIWVINSANKAEGKPGQVVKYRADGTKLFDVNLFEDPTAISVNPSDGSCWVADRTFNSNGVVVKLSKEGSELFRVDDFTHPQTLSVNPLDGTVWIADCSKNSTDHIIKLSAEGTELFRVGGFNHVSSIALDINEGNCWVADRCLNDATPGKVIKLSSEGDELLRVKRVKTPYSVAVNNLNGVCWISNKRRVIKVSRNGEELLRVKGFKDARTVSVNPSNSEVWVADIKKENTHELIKLSSEGEKLKRVKGIHFDPKAVSVLSVNSGDGSIWLADSQNGRVVKFKADGEKVFSKGVGHFRVTEAAVNPTDNSCWVLNWFNEVIRFDSDGNETVRVKLFDGSSEWGESMSVNPGDGSLWVTASYEKKVVKISPDGKKLFEVSGFDFPYSVSVDPSDGSCWVGDYYKGKIMKLDADGKEIFRRNSFTYPIVAVNPKDGSCWVADNGEIFRYAPNGTELMRAVGDYSPSSISVDPSDNSCWVMYTPVPAYPILVKYSMDGSKRVVNENMAHAFSLSVNPHDNCCWVANGIKGFKKIAGHGTELLSVDLESGSHSFGVSVHPGISGSWLPRIFQNADRGKLVIKGSRCFVKGRIHSHGNILIKGAKNTVEGDISAVKKIFVKGRGNDILHQKNKAYTHAMASYDLSDFKESADYIHEENWIVDANDFIADGIHYVEGDAIIEKDDISPLLTIVATGTIQIIGDRNEFTAADGEMKILFFAGKNLEIKGQGSVFTGILYAPEGLLRMKGPRQTIKGSLIADRVSINGNRNKFQPYAMNDFETAILEHRNDMI